MSKELIKRLRNAAIFATSECAWLMTEAADALEAKAAPVGDGRGHDTKGSRKALGAMNAKLKAKIGRLERELAAYQREQQPQWPTTPGLSARPSDDELWDQTLTERDSYHEAADKLTAAIAKHFEQDFGEHSNLNEPWSNALEFMSEQAAAAPSAPKADDPVKVQLLEALEELLAVVEQYDLPLSDPERIAARAAIAAARQEGGKV